MKTVLNVPYYELRDLRYINPDLTQAVAKKYLYELGIAKQKHVYELGEYPILLPFEFNYPKDWLSNFKKSRLLYGEYCLIRLETKEFKAPSRSQLRYYKADGMSGAYYTTSILLTREGVLKFKEFVETSPHLFPMNYTAF